MPCITQPSLQTGLTNTPQQLDERFYKITYEFYSITISQAIFSAKDIES